MNSVEISTEYYKSQCSSLESSDPPPSEDGAHQTSGSSPLYPGRRVDHMLRVVDHLLKVGDRSMVESSDSYPPIPSSHQSSPIHFLGFCLENIKAYYIRILGV